MKLRNGKIVVYRLPEREIISHIKHEIKILEWLSINCRYDSFKLVAISLFDYICENKYFVDENPSFKESIITKLNELGYFSADFKKTFDKYLLVFDN